MSLLERLIAPGALAVRFQPIFDLRAGEPVPHALECLVRGPADTTLEAPDLLFEYARRRREEGAVDRAAVTAIAEAAGHVHGDPRLHVNVHASTLGRDPEFAAELLHRFGRQGIAPARLVVEIVEHTDFLEERAFRRVLDELRAAGCEIALDDVGSARANFRMMLVCRPTLLKVDRELVRGVGDDPYRRAILASLRHLADDCGMALVVEGVEEESELDAVREIGVEYAQGFLLGRPLCAGELVGTEFGLARHLGDRGLRLACTA